jgi:hypothetical protein
MKKIRPKEKEKEKGKTTTPLVFVARVGPSLQRRRPRSLLACRSPCVRCHCPRYSLLPRHAHVVVVVPAVRSSSSPSSPAFVVLAIFLFVFALLYAWGVVSNVVSTSSTPYEQWLAGGVGVLCDVAPIATLRAEARSGGVGWPWVGCGLQGRRRGSGTVVVIKPEKKRSWLVKKKKSKVRNIPGAQMTLVVVWALCVRSFEVALS